MTEPCQQRSLPRRHVTSERGKCTISALYAHKFIRPPFDSAGNNYCRRLSRISIEDNAIVDRRTRIDMSK